MKTDKIPTTGFNDLAPETKTSAMIGNYRAKGLLTLSIFSILQMIAGLKVVEKEWEYLSKKLNMFSLKTFHLLTLSGKLYEAAIAPTFADEVDIRKVDVSRDEVLMMVELIKLRLIHCEQQRANNDPTFNPDTYIGQKQLLLELLQWLMVDVIEFTHAVEDKNYETLEKTQ